MAKTDYQSPGMTLSEIVTRIAEVMGNQNTSDTTVTAKIYEAISFAGQTAATWDSRGWWWSRHTCRMETDKATVSTTARSSNTVTVTLATWPDLEVGQYVYITGVSEDDFDGVHRVASVDSGNKQFTYSQTDDDDTSTDGTCYPITYNLRTQDERIMRPLTVSLDDYYRLRQTGKNDWDSWYSQWASTTAMLARYAIWEESFTTDSTETRPLWMGVMPIDTTNRELTVEFVQNHSKIDADSNDAALIVPSEFHRSVYVDGALFLLKQDVMDQSMLSNASWFRAVMDRMARLEPENFDPESNVNRFPDAQTGPWPSWGRRVHQTGDGWTLIRGDISL